MQNALRRMLVGALVAAICSLSILQSAKAHEDPASRALLRVLAMEGSAYAAFELGILHEPEETAFEWFAEAAERGHVLAMCKLAQRYDPASSRALYWYNLVLERVKPVLIQQIGDYEAKASGGDLCDALLFARLVRF